MNKLAKTTLLSFISAASFSSAFMSPMLPKVAKAFAVSSTMTQQLMSVFLIGYVISQLIYGPIANSFGRIKALRLGFLINIIGVIVCLIGAYSLQFSVLILGRLITSLGSSAGLVCTFILIREYFEPEEAKSVFSYAVLSFTLGVGIAVFAGGILVDLIGLNASFIILLAHGLLLWFATFSFEEPKAALIAFRPNTIIKGYVKAIKQPTLVYFAMVLSLCAAINYCYTAAAPLIAVKTFGLSASAYGSWNLFNIAGMFLSAFAGAALLKAFSSKQVIAIASAGLIICLLLLFAIGYYEMHQPLFFFSVSMLLFVVAGIFFPAASDLATKAYEEDRGSASSMISFINMGMACVLVIVMSFLHLSYLNAMLVTLGGYLLLLLVLPLLAKVAFGSIE